MDSLTPEEDRLLTDLREALLAAQHPQAQLMIANAQDAFSYASLEEELAHLVYDSLLESDPAGTVRAAELSRMVIFECPAMTMELEIRGRDVVGQIGPPGLATVSMETCNGVVAEVQADDLGCFTIRLSESYGPLRFRVSRPGSSAITEWTYGPDPS